MRQRWNLRALAGICEFHLSYFKRLKLNGSLIPETSADLNHFFGTSRAQAHPRLPQSEKHIIL